MVLQIVGVLKITNFNSALVVKKCAICKGQNINILLQGAYCSSCNKEVTVAEVVKLHGEITNKEQCVEVTLSGEAIDKVLTFEEPLLQLCKTNIGLARVFLSEVCAEGVFMVDPQGQIMGHRKVEP